MLILQHVRSVLLLFLTDVRMTYFIEISQPFIFVRLYTNIIKKVFQPWYAHTNCVIYKTTNEILYICETTEINCSIWCGLILTYSFDLYLSVFNLWLKVQYQNMHTLIIVKLSINFPKYFRCSWISIIIFWLTFYITGVKSLEGKGSCLAAMLTMILPPPW